MNTDPKYQIHNPHENQRFSGEILRLEDKSSGLVTTDCIEDFLAFVRDTEVPAGSHPILYAAPTSVLAYVAGKVDRYTAPFAKLELTVHPRLSLLIQANKRSLELREAEELLRRLREGLDDSGRAILHNLRDLKVVKNLQMEQKKEPGGNFSFAFKMESGLGDWKPDEKASFTVPFFNFVEDQVALPFDFSVSLTDIGEGKEQKQGITVKFECLDIDEHLLNGHRAILLNNLKESGFPVMWGNLSVQKGDDSWSVLHNHAEGIERLK